MKVVYIAGPFRGSNHWVIEQNIRRAEALSLEVWRLGAVGFCPHTNTRFFHGAADDDLWLRGNLEMLTRCDALMVTEDWDRSPGARAEVALAKQQHIPVFHTLDGLAYWLTHGQTQ